MRRICRSLVVVLWSLLVAGAGSAAPLRTPAHVVAPGPGPGYVAVASQAASAPDLPVLELDAALPLHASGYAYRPLHGWQTRSLGGLAVMHPPDADPLTGPFVLLNGGGTSAFGFKIDAGTEGVTDSLLNAVIGMLPGQLGTIPEVTEQEPLGVAGALARTARLHAVSEGVAIEGRLVLLRPDPARLFFLLGFAPEERWATVAPSLDAVLGGISFFEPGTAPLQPVVSGAAGLLEVQEHGSDAGDAAVAEAEAIVVHRVQTDLPYVAITIDDFDTGDFRRRTGVRMLQAANAAQATLTLCPSGHALDTFTRLAPQQAAELKHLVAAGSHELCNHTFFHPIMPQIGLRGGVAAEVAEINRGAAAIHEFFGRPPSPIFRPPFGSWEATTRRAAVQAGYAYMVAWSVDSGDAVGPEKSPEQIVANVACARAGDIILMHANRGSSAAALPLILDMLQRKGLKPVSVSSLLASGTPVLATHSSHVLRSFSCRP